VAIIGAGPSGLSAAVCLQRRNIPLTLFERGAQLFFAWRRIDPDVCLLSPTCMTLLPGMESLPGDRAYQTFRSFTEKLEDYARRNEIMVKTLTRVICVSQNNGAFQVAYEDGKGASHSLDFTHVVNATGLLSFPVLPVNFSSQDCKIPWKHSLDVRENDLKSARQLLVVGARISAGEIIDRWMQSKAPGAHAWVSAKSRNIHIRPTMLGVNLHYVSWLPEHVPSQWFGRSLGIYQEPMISKYFSSGLRSGNIERVPGVRCLNPASVTLENDEEISPDFIVFATGYDYSLDHLKGLFDFDLAGNPRICCCESLKVKNVYLLGYRFGRTFASPYIRGIGRDAEFIAQTIATRTHNWL